ncbi:hypothetical protein V2P64_04120 [Mycoplasma leachii]
MKIYLKANRTEKIDNKNGLIESDIDKDKSIEAFEIYSQYLKAPYYIPRYSTDHIFFKDINKKKISILMIMAIYQKQIILVLTL